MATEPDTNEIDPNVWSETVDVIRILTASPGVTMTIVGSRNLTIGSAERTPGQKDAIDRAGAAGLRAIKESLVESGLWVDDHRA